MLKIYLSNDKLPIINNDKLLISPDSTDFLVSAAAVTRNSGGSSISTAGGTVTNGGIVESSQSITITATPKTNYTFQGWTTNITSTSYVSTDLIYTFTPTSHIKYYAVFKLNTYNATATAVTRNSSDSTASTTGGTVSGSVTNIDYGSTVTLTASAKSNYTFQGWATSTTATNYVSTSASYTFTLTSAVTYYAIFKLDMYNVTATAVTRNSSTSTNSTIGGTVSGSGSKDYGSSVTFTATAATGYTFQGWATSNDATSYVSTNASYTFTVSGNVTYYAIFKANLYTVTPTAVTRDMSAGTSTVSTTGGIVSGGATKDYGASITLTATAADGYSFAGWSTSTTGTEYVSTNASYTFIVSNSNTTLYAIFTEFIDLQVYSTTSSIQSSSSIGFDVSSTGINSVSDIRGYIISPLISVTGGITNGNVFGIINDTSMTKAYITTSNQVQELSSLSVTLAKNGNNITFTLPSGYQFISSSGSGSYQIIVLYYGSNDFTFNTTTFAPGSGITAGTFSVSENPPLYFIGLSSSVNVEQWHRVQTVTKYNSTLKGSNFYSSSVNYITDLTETYNNGTLNIATSGSDNGGYFHNPGTYTLYYINNINSNAMPSWSNATDEEIVAMLEAAHNGTIDLQQDGGWAVGDVRTITVGAFTGGGNVSHAQQQIDIVITSFDEYENCGNVLQFDFKQTLATNNRMGTSQTNSGGYGSTEMYTTTLPALVNALPSWLQNSLIEFSVLATTGNQSSTVTTINGNKLAFRSEVEVRGSESSMSFSGEGSQLVYYAISNNRIKVNGINGSATTRWWLRSPRSGNTTGFCCITIDGDGTGGSSNNTYAVAPFGCL